MNECPEILFNDSVHHLRLAVRLGVISSAHPKGCVAKLEELLPEMADEQRIPIRDETSWGTVELTRDFHEHSGNSEGCIVGEQ